MIEAEDNLAERPLFIPSRKTALIVASLMVLLAAMSWLAVGYDLGEVRTVMSVRAGDSLEPTELLAHNRAGLLVSRLQVVFALLVAGAFLPWLYQARVNVRALGARRLRYERRMTYLGFLLPVLNFFRPFQVMNEVARSSDPTALDPLGWLELPSSRLAVVWWGGFVTWATAEAFSTVLLSAATGLARIQFAHSLALLGDLGAAVGASVGMLLVLQVQRHQQEKWNRLQARAGEAP